MMSSETTRRERKPAMDDARSAAKSPADAVDDGIGVLRFRDLPGRESTWRPLDMELPEFERTRYAVAGRPREGTATSALDALQAFNITYLKCAPGKGIGGHAHATPEVFIVMSGRWSVTLGPDGEQSTILEPWDIIAVTPDEMHGAVNISDEDGWIMTINAGHGGAKIRWAPSVLAALAARGVDIAAEEMPGETLRGEGARG
jgi:quercetin dioxygenase-like cupin family protein